MVAAQLDGLLQGRGRYVQALHVLGELKDTIACDITRARAELGYDPQTSLLDGMRASVRWLPRARAADLMAADAAHHRWGGLLRLRPGRPALGAEGHAVRIFDLNPPDEPNAESSRAAATSATSTRCAAACDGVDAILHNVAQVPLAKDRELFWSVNVVGTANVLLAARDAKVGEGRAHVVERDLRHPGVEPGGGGHAAAPARGVRQGEARGASCCAATRSRAGARRLDRAARARSSATAGSGSWRSCSSSSPTARRCSCSAAGDNRYQFVHADDLADACLRAARAARCRRPTTSAVATFGTMRETLQALVDHAGTGSHVVSLPVEAGAGRDAGRSGSRRWSPFAPYHWLLYGESLWFDVTKAERELGWQPDALERVGGDRVLRVVPRAPRRSSAATASPHHQSAAPSSALLKLVSACPCTRHGVGLRGG